MCDFFSISDEYDSLQKAYNNLVESGDSPAGLVPIADDPNGNYLFLSVAEDDFGKVCFGDHELRDSETGYIVVSDVAESFTEFLNIIYIMDDLEDQGGK